MTVLSAQSILSRTIHQYPTKDGYSAPWALIIEPFEPEAKQALGMSYGLTAAGYDIRVGDIGNGGDSTQLRPGAFRLIASLERIRVPTDLQVIVHDKSSWAREGLALQNTVLEPGWEGFITLELSNHGTKRLLIKRGQPIAQLVFHQLDSPTDRPYTGKYQNQGSEPQEAIHMETHNETWTTD